MFTMHPLLNSSPTLLPDFHRPLMELSVKSEPLQVWNVKRSWTYATRIRWTPIWCVILYCCFAMLCDGASLDHHRGTFDGSCCGGGHSSFLRQVRQRSTQIVTFLEGKDMEEVISIICMVDPVAEGSRGDTWNDVVDLSPDNMTSSTFQESIL